MSQPTDQDLESILLHGPNQNQVGKQALVAQLKALRDTVADGPFNAPDPNGAQRSIADKLHEAPSLKDLANIKGDGTPEAEEIRKALVRAQNLASPILVPPGLYNVSGISLLRVTGSLTLIGMPGAHFVGSGAETLLRVPSDTEASTIRIENIRFSEFRMIAEILSTATINIFKIKDCSFYNVQRPIYSARDLTAFHRSEIGQLFVENVSIELAHCGIHLLCFVREAIIRNLTMKNISATSSGAGAAPMTRGLVLGYDAREGFPVSDLREMGNFTIENITCQNFYEGRQNAECQGVRLVGNNVSVKNIRGLNLDNVDGVECELLYTKCNDLLIDGVWGRDAGRREGMVALKGLNDGWGQRIICRNIFHAETREAAGNALWVQAKDVWISGLHSTGGSARTESAYSSGNINISSVADQVRLSNVTMVNIRGRSAIHIESGGRVEIADLVVQGIDGAAYGGDTGPVSAISIANGTASSPLTLMISNSRLTAIKRKGDLASVLDITNRASPTRIAEISFDRVTVEAMDHFICSTSNVEWDNLIIERTNYIGVEGEAFAFTEVPKQFVLYRNTPSTT